MQKSLLILQIMNKPNMIQNTKWRSNDSTITGIKKRLHRIFQESQFVLIWATFKPLNKTLPSQLEKKIIVGAVNTVDVSKKEQKKNVLTFLQDDMGKTTKISKISFPKDALKTFCLNVNLPIVGSGLDLLVVTKVDLLSTKQSLTSKATVSEKKKKTPVLFAKEKNIVDTAFFETSPLDCSIKEQSKVLPVELRNPISNVILKGFTRLLKTHQVALFMNLAQDEALKLEEKWESNQLLGAFIKSSESAIFITSAELKQTLLLHKHLKKAPKLVVKQPFIEVLIKTKSVYSKPSKCLLCLPLKKLIFLINYSTKRLRLNLSLASTKKQLVKNNT